MTLTKRTQRNLISALVASAFIPSAVVLADDYQDARAELIAAYQAEDYSAMQLAAQKALIARPEYPGALFNLAMAYTLNGRHRDSLRILRRLTDKGVDFGVAEIEEFSALRDLDGWDSYRAGVQALSEAVGIAEVISTYGESEFVPEGIAIDDDGHLILGSIRSGQIVKLAPDPEVLLEREQHWSVFGMRFHSDGGLWFASAAVPQLANVGDDQGKTGLFRFDEAAGEITQVAILPQYEPTQVLGDLVIADDNTGLAGRS